MIMVIRTSPMGSGFKGSFVYLCASNYLIFVYLSIKIVLVYSTLSILRLSEWTLLSEV